MMLVANDPMIIDPSISFIAIKHLSDHDSLELIAA